MPGDNSKSLDEAVKELDKAVDKLDKYIKEREKKGNPNSQLERDHAQLLEITRATSRTVARSGETLSSMDTKLTILVVISITLLGTIIGTLLTLLMG